MKHPSRLTVMRKENCRIKAVSFIMMNPPVQIDHFELEQIDYSKRAYLMFGKYP